MYPFRKTNTKDILKLKSGEKGVCLSGGPPTENFYIFEALGLNSVWRFLKQIRKQVACKLTVFYKNGYHFTKIITLLRKFYLKMSKF